MNKSLLITLFSVLVVVGCSQKLKPIGCWEDQFQSVYRFKPQGVVTVKIKGELRPRHRGTWEMIDDSSFILKLSDQEPENYNIVDMSKEQMTLKLDGDAEFSWAKNSCL